MAVRKIRKTWWVDFRYDGRRYRVRSPENSKAGASAYEALLRRRLVKGETLRPETMPSPESPTFGEFSADWMRDYAVANNKPSELRGKRSRLKRHLVPFFGEKKLDEITSADVERFKTSKLFEGLSPKSVNNHLATLAKCLRTAREWGRTDKEARIQLLKVPPQRFDYLTSDESRILVGAARQEPFWCDFIICALRTGMRRGEIFGLDWQDVDFGNMRVNIRQNIVDGFVGSPKNNRARFVPLTPDLAARLVGRVKRSGLVFGQVDGRPLTSELARVALDRITKRANLRHLGWHSLRHTYATQLVGAGVPIRTVQELMGHADIKMTMRYAHVAPDALFEAVKVLPLLEENDVEKFGQQAVNAPNFVALKAIEYENIEVLISAKDKQKSSSEEKHFCW